MTKKVISAILALSMLFMTACGDSSSTTESSKTESSSATETTTTTATTTQTTTTTKTETGVSAETIDEFANAYASTPHVQNCNRETSSSYYTRQAAMSDDGKYVYHVEWPAGANGLYRYNRETKKNELIVHGAVTDFAYCNGFVYITGWQGQRFYISKHDESGKLIKEINDSNAEYWYDSSSVFPSAPIYVLDNGMVAVQTCYSKKDKDRIDGGREEISVLFSADLETSTVIWHEDTNNKHGVIRKDRPNYVTNVGFYCYHSDEDKISIFDANTSKWTDYECKNRVYRDLLVFGNYVIGWNDWDTYSTTGEMKSYVFDRNTGKPIDLNVVENYKGGKYVYELRGISGQTDYNWCRIDALVDDITESKYTEVSPQKNEGNWYRLDDKYYWFFDSYGCFLRTYEKGENEEETIWVYDEH